MNLPDFLQTVIAEPQIERLGWVLLHSLWQFTLVTLLVSGVMRVLRERSASLRYGVLVAAMTLMVGASLVTWSLLPVAQNDLRADDHATTFEPTLASRSPLAEAHEFDAALLPDVPLPEAGADAVRLNDETRTDVAAIAETSVEPSFVARLTGTLRPWLPWIVCVWLFGVVVCALRPLFGWLTLWRLKRIGVTNPSDAVRAALLRMSDRLGIHRAVRVLQSTIARVPLVAGYFRPVILLPVSFLTHLPTEQLEAILAHELAHIRRHDFVVNLLQTLVETFFFYHPAVWWLSRRIRIEREHCCDDLVVAVLGNHAEYGRALVAVEELRGQTSLLTLAASDGSLLSRIRRIVNPRSENSAALKGRSFTAGLCMALGLCLAAVVGSGFAHQAADDGAATPDRFVAKLPGDIEVELIGVATHPSNGQDWWTPDGRVIPAEEIVGRLSVTPESPGEFSVMKGSPKQSQCREFLIHIRGLPPGNAVTTDYGNVNAAAGGEYHKGLWIGYHGAGPFSGDTTAIRVGLTTEDYGPTVAINANGRKVPSEVALDEELKELYERVVPLGVRRNEGETILLLEKTDAYNQLNRECVWELHAIDLEGEKHRSATESTPVEGPRELLFRMPIEKIQRFEYRMKAFRHWVTFDNVSLQRGKRTDVGIKVQSPPQKPDIQAAENVDTSYFTSELRLKLSRSEAHNGKWFFVDLDRVQLLKPPFSVEIDQDVLPYKVITPEESKLNGWLKKNGVDLILSSKPKPFVDGTRRMRQVVQTRSIRTQLKHVASRVPSQNGGLWTWDAVPATVASRYARKNDDVFVSGFVPASSSGEVDPETPDLSCFRTAENVVGVYILEQPDFAKDELRLRIAHVADSHLRMQDVSFEKGEVLSGKDGPADPVRFRKDRLATIHGRIVHEDGSEPTIKGLTYRHVMLDGGNRLMNSEGQFVDRFTIKQAAGRVWFAHFVDGFAPAFSEAVHVRSGEERAVKLVLKRGDSAWLKLADEKGQPIVGAAVSFYPQFDGASVGTATVGTSGQRGEILLDHVADLPYLLTVRAPGYEPIVRKLIRVTDQVDVLQTMRRSKLTSGTVRNADGTPAVGAKLRAMVDVYRGGAHFLHDDGPGNWGEIVTTTDGEGRFVLDQLSGDLRRLFIVETTYGARAIVRDLECGQDNVEITVPERRDLVVRIKGDISQLAERRGKRTAKIQQHVDFKSEVGNAGCIVGGDATIDMIENGGIAVFRGLATELNSPLATKQRVQIELGDRDDLKRNVDLNLLGETRVGFVLSQTADSDSL